MKGTLIVSLLLWCPCSAAFERIGNAHCRSDEAGQCHLVWDMTATPRAEYVLERFDMEEHAWQPHQALPDRHAGVTGQALPAESLLRVRGCRDYIRQDSCVTSVVVWVPFIASSFDELPDSVQLGPGEPPLGLVSQNHTIGLANFNYNAGRLTYVMNVIDPNDVTPMTPPPVRHFDYEIVEGKVHRFTGRNPELNAREVTQEIFIHNEMFIMWEGWIYRKGAGRHRDRPGDARVAPGPRGSGSRSVRSVRCPWKDSEGGNLSESGQVSRRIMGSVPARS